MLAVMLTAAQLFFGGAALWGGQWLVRNYTEQEGLPSPHIKQMIQDQWGRMWFASSNGVACYDGMNWTVFREGAQLPFAMTERLAIGTDGRLWAISASDERDKLVIVSFDGKSWRSEFIPPNPDAQPWKALTAFHVRTLPGDGAIEILIGVNGQGVLLLTSGKWRVLSSADGLPSNNVQGAAFFGGKYYIATDKGLVTCFGEGAPETGLEAALGLPSSNIRGIAIESSERFPIAGADHIWFCGDDWLMSLDRKGRRELFSNIHFRFDLRNSPILIQPDYIQGLFLSNPFEIIYFNVKTLETTPVDTSRGLVSEGANDVFIDFEKNAWIACNRGVSKISGRTFENLDKRDGLLENEVTAILETKPGSFLLGHNYGLTFYDSNGPQRFPLNDADKIGNNLLRVLEMAKDEDNNVWMALSHTGLGRLNPQKKITCFTLPFKESVAITSLLIHKTGELWVGCQKGLFFFKNGAFTHIPLDKHPAPLIRKIQGDTDGPRFISSMTTGLYIHKNDRWVNFRAQGPVGKGRNSANSVYGVAEFREVLLVGTSAGLYHIRGNYLEKFTENGFSIERPVFFIYTGENGAFWFGTDKGLIYWDSRNAYSYTTLNGLCGMESNRSACLRDSRGKMWFGTNQGVSIYDRNFDLRRVWSPPPRLRFLAARSREQVFSMEQPMNLGSSVFYLVITFQGISFIDESALLFRHKMEGYDSDWQEESYPYRQTLRYSGLPPGVYHFHLKVKNIHGVWSREIVSAPIIVSQPFFRRWWFILAAAALAGLIMYSIVSYISGKRYAVRLERQIRERTRQLEATERRYRELFLESKDVVFTASISGKFLDINPAGVELFGYDSREEMLTVDIPSQLYINPADRDVFYTTINRNGFVRDYELEMKKKNGERVILQVAATVLRDENGVVFADRGIMRDITENKRLQRQLEHSQKMEAIGQLAGGIAHDFNNILSVINGYVELALEEGPMSDRARKDISQVLIASNRARDLINQILTFSRQSVRERKPLIIAPIVKEVLKLMRSSLPSTIAIRIVIRDDDSVVLGDPTQIHQVLMNLCTNAAYAMKENGGVLEIILEQIILDEHSAGLYNELNPGRHLRLTVSDSGSGIDPAHIKRIFEPYFTTKPQGEGSGMGLAVSHGIIKSFGGDIRVYSELGKGTTFHILLPILDIKAETPEKIHVFIPSGNLEHVLLVDDEAPLAEVEKMLLEKSGYTVTAFASSPDALQFFRQDPYRFNIIITDLTMPDLTGIQLIREIRLIRPDMPVILCTGFSESLTEEQIRHLGINELLMKPVDKNSLSLSIQRALNRPGQTEPHGDGTPGGV